MASSTVGSLHVALSADTAEFVQQLNNAAGQVNNLFGKMVGSQLVADALQEMGKAIWDVGASSLQLAGELEQSKVAFETMLGSAEKAEAFLKELATFAANTPFEMKGLQEASRKLIAFGFQGKDIIPIMTGVGNAVAGLGGSAEHVNRVTMALGQMQAKGKISGEEMLQLAEMGIPAWDILAKKLGVTIPEAMKMAEKGMIPAAKGIEALVNGMNERFPNMMEKQSKLLLGAWGNLQDGISQSLTAIGMEIIETFNVTETIAGLGRVTTMVAAQIQTSGLDGLMDKIFGAEMKAAILGIGTAISVAVIPKLLAMAPAAAVAAASMASSAAAAVIAWAPFLAMAGAIAFAATPIIRYWDDIAFELGRVFDFVSGKAGEFINWAVKGFQHLANNVVGPVVNFIRDKLSALWGAMPQQAKDALNAIGAGFGNLATPITGTLNLVGMAANATGGALKFAGANMAESFSGFGDMAKGVQGIINTFMGSATGDLAKLQKDATLHLAGANKALGGAGAAAGAAKGKVSAAAKAMAEATKAAAKEMVESLERGQDALKGFAGKAAVLTELNGGLKSLQVEARLFGDGFVEASDVADRYKTAIQGLLKQGLEPTNPMVQQLTARWREYSAAADASKVKTFDVGAEMANMAKELTMVDAKAAVLGDTFNASGAKLSIYEKQLEDLAVNGFGPASKEVLELKQKIDALKPPKPSGFKAFFDDLRDNTTDVLNAVNGLTDGVKTLAEGLGIATDGPVFSAIGKFSDMAGAAVKVGTSINELMPMFVSLAGYIASTVVPAIVSAVPVIGTLLTGAFTAVGVAISAAIWPITLIAAGIAAAIIAGQLLYENWEAISAFLMPIWQGISDFGTAVWGGLSATIGTAMGAVWSVISGTWNAIAGLLKPLWDGLTASAWAVGEALVAAFAWAESPIRAVWDGITAVFKGAFNAMIATINTLIRGINNIRIQVPDWVPGIGGKGWGGFNFPQIPFLAEGGVIGSPTLAMVGEGKNKEAVVPLSPAVFSQMGQGIVSQTPGLAGQGGSVSGDTTITINIQSNDPRAVGEEVVRVLRRAGIKV